MAQRRRALLRLDVGRSDHPAPLLGFRGDEVPEVCGRARNRDAAQIGEPRLHLGIGEARVNLLVDFVMTSAGVPFGAPTPYPKWAT